MPLTTFLGLLTLAPAVLGLLVLAVGLLKYPRAPLVIGLAILGALVPAVCLLFLSPALSGGDLILVQPLFGGVTGPNAWFSPAYRLDGFDMFAAYGVAFIVAPLLLWLAFHGDMPSVEDAAETQADDTAERDGARVATPASVPGGPMSRALTPPQWGGVALALGAESAALMLVFSDNVLWLALNWILLAALLWGVGEMGSDVQTMDRLGLALMLAGPVLWLVAFLLPFLLRQTPRTIFPSFAEMMGRGGTAPVYVVLLSVALALAAGAYPFLGWVRRRAALITPAGFAGLLLLALPVALFVGARTYAALQDASSFWPQIGQARPPITAGIAMALLGALTAGAAGLLALGRRDGRSLLALVALVQVGWGLLALGTGTAVSALAVTLLLATGTLGLGAMIAALYAGGALLSDIEPEATGPRALGAPVRPLHLFAWTVGAATLVGAPLFAGFLPRQLASAGAVQARGLIVPLSALAWIGDGLLALALLRATAPAFAAAFASRTKDEPATGAARLGLDAASMPGALLALLALVAGIVPQALFAIGATLAASALVQGGSVALQLAIAPMGYTASGAQWLPTIGWIAAALAGLLLAFVLQRASRERRGVVLSGQRMAEAEELDRGQAIGLADAADAWSDLGGAFASPWVSPGIASPAREGDAEEAEGEADGDESEPVAGEEEAATTVDTGERAEVGETEGASADASVPAGEVSGPAGDAHLDSDTDGVAAVAPVAEAEPVAEEAAAERADGEPEPVEVAEHEAPASRPSAKSAQDSAFAMRPRQQRSNAPNKRGGRKGGR